MKNLHAPGTTPAIYKAPVPPKALVPNRDLEAIKILFIGFGVGIALMISAVLIASRLTSTDPDSSSPEVFSTLEEACSSEVKKAEGGHTTFQINSTETFASGEARVIYEVGFEAGNKDRRVATCTGTPESPLLELVSVNAARGY